MLRCYKGVLVSDFYAAYDGVNCPQQKCLIHLIRDLNQMLLANPFDAEVQSAAERFGTLLRQIVATIDEHGLRRHYLRRHRADIDRYFEALAKSSPQSESAQAIRERLLRYQGKLFTFVDHDDVAWNNNPAENSIKQFAYYREGRTGIMREPDLRDYLTLLSIYQTCRYRGVEFLRSCSPANGTSRHLRLRRAGPGGSQCFRFIRGTSLPLSLFRSTRRGGKPRFR